MSGIYVVTYNSCIKSTMNIVVVAKTKQNAVRMSEIPEASIAAVVRVGIADDHTERILAYEEP